MSTKNIKQIAMALAAALGTLVAALYSGCDSKPDAPRASAGMPAVTDETCTSENIDKVDAAMRKQFASACLRRGSFKPSASRTW
jgi:entry exclusion lipoprotein TrbK